MGLDIYGIKILDEVKNNEKDDFDEDVFNTSWNLTFIFQLGNLKLNTIYNTEIIDCSNIHFSYSGYSRFREALYNVFIDGDIMDFYNNEYYNKIITTNFTREKKLNRILDIEDDLDLDLPPFFEILFFSDSEGIIAPIICEKLYEDFKKYKDKAKEKMPVYFYETYLEFMTLMKEVTENKSGLLYA